MSEYTRVVLEGDTRGRANISALDANGTGHGYRLAGPKYIGDIVDGVTTPKTFEVELGEEDVNELHSYLRIWDEINLGDEAPEWAALIEASDRYRQATTDLARVRTYPDFPAKRLEEIGARREQARRRLVQAAGALAEVSVTKNLKSV
jgi:hypothetical protein